MLALIRSDNSSAVESEEVKERIRAVAHNCPGLLEEMKPTVSQLRNASLKYGIRPNKGETFVDLPLLSVRGPLVNNAVNNFSRKLACALHYKHAEIILPASATIEVLWYSNLEIDNDEIPREFVDVLIELPKLRRSNNDLQEQFFYRWGMTDTKTMLAFLCFFRRSFAILVLVNSSENLLATLNQANRLQPYAWV
jgi:hypothetical protein